MKKITTMIVSVLLLLAVNLTSCGSSDPLNNTSWYLVEMDGEGIIKDTHISISFYNGEIDGNGGCNRYSGEYSTDEPDIIQIGGGSMTDEGCLEPEGILEQETAYNKYLRQAAFFNITNNTLTLYDNEQNANLVFIRRTVHLMDPSDLVGTDWLLETLNDTPVPEELEINLSFTSSSEASGRAGNYTYRLLDYEAKGDIIRWGIQSGRDGDLAYDLQRFALAYLDAITTGTHQYNQTEDTLELFTQKGDTLVYRPMTTRD